jgi:glycosyltransferase involved in cell wall biosynthesis
VTQGPLELVYVAPIRARSTSTPNRPEALLRALSATARFDRITVVVRMRPDRYIRQIAQQIQTRIGESATVPSEQDVVSVCHPWPFGYLEELVVSSRVRQAEVPTVLWIADPKTMTTFARRIEPRVPLLRVADLYDAWDLSPIVRGAARRRAVSRGYAAAAANADLVFANTDVMARRIRALGAQGHVEVLPNASPAPQLMDGDRRRYLAYVGRIHERFDAALVGALARELPGVLIHIAGPVDREPPGWQQLLSLPNVRALGPVDPSGARLILGHATAAIVPHVVDDYTRSQDAMKAWDAISVGTPVLSTRIPPADGWPDWLALVADGPAEFISKAKHLLEGEPLSSRQRRVEYAAANGWDARARTVIDRIDALIARRDPTGATAAT